MRIPCTLPRKVHLSYRVWSPRICTPAGLPWATARERTSRHCFSYRFVRWRDLPGPAAGKWPPEASFRIALYAGGTSLGQPLGNGLRRPLSVCKQICRGFGPLVFYRSAWPCEVQANLPIFGYPRFLSLRLAIRGVSKSAEVRIPSFFIAHNGHQGCKQICRFSDTLLFYRSEWPSKVQADLPMRVRDAFLPT